LRTSRGLSGFASSGEWQPAYPARNTTYIYPFEDNPDFNLTTAMADEAIAYMKWIDALNPEQPFFVYCVPGGTSYNCKAEIEVPCGTGC
jgi:hypothetical protein